MFALPLSSEDILKTSSRRLGQNQYIRLHHTSSRRLEDIFKTSSGRLVKRSSRRFEDVFSKSCKNVFKASSRRLQNVFKTSCKNVSKKSSRRLQDIVKQTSSRNLQDIFKAYHQVKLFLLTHLQEVFNTFLRRFFPKTVIYREIFLGNITSEKFMVSVQNL